MKPLTPRQSAVLAYVVTRGNCSASDVAYALGINDTSTAYDRLSRLQGHRLVGKQCGFFGDVRWVPTDAGAEYNANGRAVAQDGAVGVQAPRAGE